MIETEKVKGKLYLGIKNDSYIGPTIEILVLDHEIEKHEDKNNETARFSKVNTHHLLNKGSTLWSGNPREVPN